MRGERQCEDGSWDLEVELDSSELAKLLGVKGVRAEPRAPLREQRVA